MEEGKGEERGGEGRGVLDLPLKYMVTLVDGSLNSLSVFSNYVLVLCADYKSLRKLVVSKPFQGVMISVQKVAHSCCIRVDGVTQISDEMISLHFENRRRSGGGEVNNVAKYNDVAIVQFKNRKGILEFRTITSTKEIVFLPSVSFVWQQNYYLSHCYRITWESGLEVFLLT